MAIFEELNLEYNECKEPVCFDNTEIRVISYPTSESKELTIEICWSIDNNDNTPVSNCVEWGLDNGIWNEVDGETTSISNKYCASITAPSSLTTFYFKVKVIIVSPLDGQLATYWNKEGVLSISIMECEI